MYENKKFYYQLCTMQNYRSLVSDSSNNFICKAKPAQLLRIGHRGCGANKDYTELSAHLPEPFKTDKCSIAENTITAFNQARDHGMDGSEFDIVLTRDGVPVINHNFEVNGFPVNSLTLEQFKKQEIVGFENETRPTFKELLNQSKVQVLDVEVKYPSTENHYIGLKYFSRQTVVKKILANIQEYLSAFEETELTKS